MNRTILALAFLLVTSSAATAQFTPSTENLRGLTGVRLMVMLGHYPHRLDEAERPEVLKLVEADAMAKLEGAGIPFYISPSDPTRKAGYAILVITVTMDEFNPVTTEVKLLQQVRLQRDPSIEFEAVTWSIGGGVGPKGIGPEREAPMIRHQVAGEVDRFIQDYFSVNPKQSAKSGKDTKR
jgi:hypothetical protein